MLYDRITDKGKTYTVETMICLVPLVVMSVYYYGFRALLVSLISMLVCYATDMISIYARKQRFEFEDISSIHTGLILALLLPATISYSKVSIAAVFTIILGKQIFGGNENIIFQPVTVGYALVTLCWRDEFLMFPKPQVANALAWGDVSNVERIHSLTYHFDSGVIPQMDQFDVLMGKFSGPMGTTHIIIIAICALCLFFRRKASFTTFFCTCIVLVGTSVLIPKIDNLSFIYTIAYEMITGASLYILLFIASDSRIAPITFVGKALYGFAIGGFTVVFRRYAMVEQGMIFAVILAGLMVPTFDFIGGSSRFKNSNEFFENIYNKDFNIQEKFDKYKQRFIK